MKRYITPAISLDEMASQAVMVISNLSKGNDITEGTV